MPAMVIGADVVTAPSATPVCAVKATVFGVVSAPVGAAVMLVNGTSTPPMLTVVVVIVLLALAALCRMVTVWPLDTTPAFEVNTPSLME